MDWKKYREAGHETKNERKDRKPERGDAKPGSRSNQIIRQRNGGVRHQFEDDIGGCSANYK